MQGFVQQFLLCDERVRLQHGYVLMLKMLPIRKASLFPPSAPALGLARMCIQLALLLLREKGRFLVNYNLIVVLFCFLFILFILFLAALSTSVL